MRVGIGLVGASPESLILVLLVIGMPPLFLWGHAWPWPHGNLSVVCDKGCLRVAFDGDVMAFLRWLRVDVSLQYGSQCRCSAKGGIVAVEVYCSGPRDLICFCPPHPAGPLGSK